MKVNIFLIWNSNKRGMRSLNSFEPFTSCARDFSFTVTSKTYSKRFMYLQVTSCVHGELVERLSWKKTRLLFHWLFGDIEMFSFLMLWNVAERTIYLPSSRYFLKVGLRMSYQFWRMEMWFSRLSLSIFLYYVSNP